MEKISGEEEKVGKWLQKIESEGDAGQRHDEEVHEVKMMDQVAENLEKALSQVEKEEKEFDQIVKEIKELHRRNKKQLKNYANGRGDAQGVMEKLNAELQAMEMVAKPLKNQARLTEEIEEEEQEAEQEISEEVKIVKSDNEGNSKIGKHVKQEEQELSQEEEEAENLSSDLQVQAKNIQDMAAEMSGEIQRAQITEIDRQKRDSLQSEFDEIAESVEHLKI